MFKSPRVKQLLGGIAGRLRRGVRAAANEPAPAAPRRVDPERILRRSNGR